MSHTLPACFDAPKAPHLYHLMNAFPDWHKQAQLQLMPLRMPTFWVETAKWRSLCRPGFIARIHSVASSREDDEGFLRRQSEQSLHKADLSAVGNLYQIRNVFAMDTCIADDKLKPFK